MSLSEDEWWNLQKKLRALHIGTMRCTYKNPRKNKTYYGLRIIINKPHIVPSWTSFVCVMSFFKEHGIALSFSSSFSRAAGTQMAQQYFSDKKNDHFSALQKKIDLNLSDFLEKKKTITLYK